MFCCSTEWTLFSICAPNLHLPETLWTSRSLWLDASVIPVSANKMSRKVENHEKWTLLVFFSDVSSRLRWLSLYVWQIARTQITITIKEIASSRVKIPWRKLSKVFEKKSSSKNCKRNSTGTWTLHAFASLRKDIKIHDLLIIFDD